MKNEYIKVLFVSPGKKARIINTGNRAPAFRKLLKGHFTEYMPFDENHVLVARSEGRALREELNRAIRDDDGNILDVIVGDFFVAGCRYDEDEYSDFDLKSESDRKIYEMLLKPEKFIMKGGRITDAERKNGNGNDD